MRHRDPNEFEGFLADSLIVMLKVGFIAASVAVWVWRRVNRK